MTEKLTMTNVNMVNLIKNIIYPTHIHPFMFVVVVILIRFLIFDQIQLYFGHVQKLTFIIVKFRSNSNVKVCRQFFWSNSNRFSVILIRSWLALSRMLFFNVKNVQSRNNNPTLLIIGRRYFRL